MALLDEVRREIRQRAERMVRAANIQLQDELRRDSPKVTRKLEKGITVRVKTVGDVIASEAVANVPYAEPVILGARPHVIRARKPGGFLRFPDQGGVFIFRRSVNHPGNQPNPFWDKGIERWKLLLQQAADRLR